MAQEDPQIKNYIAHHLHVPAQVVRAARWQIPTLVLIRKPRDAVLSLTIRDPISVDQALRYYVSFYHTAEKYRDAYVLGLFEEVTEDFGRVIERVNRKFGTTFSLFRHDEANVNKLFAGMETQTKRQYGEKLLERKVQRPSVDRQRIKSEIEYDLDSPRAKEVDRRGRGGVRSFDDIRHAGRHQRSNDLCPAAQYAQKRACKICCRINTLQRMVYGTAPKDYSEHRSAFRPPK